MKNKTFWIILAILIVIGTGWYFSKSNISLPNVPVKDTEMKTYTDSRNGFSIQYPSSVQVNTKATYIDPLTGKNMWSDLFRATYNGDTADVLMSGDPTAVANCTSGASTGTATIGGSVFTVATISDSGAQQKLKLTYYKKLLGVNYCLVIVKTDISSSGDQSSSVLDSVIQSFRFTNR